MNIILPIPNGKLGNFPKEGCVIQWYGENPDLYKKEVGLAYHNGWDIIPTKGVAYGSAIIAPYPGVVVGTAYDPDGYGNRIDLLSDEDIDSVQLKSTFGHMTEKRMVTIGQHVQQGEQIGEMGNSGFVVSGGVPHWGQSNPDNRGTHLHWTVKKVKQAPSKYFLNSKTYIILDENNGVQGAIDIIELFTKKNVMIEFAHNLNKPTEYGFLVTTAVGTFYVPFSSEDDAIRTGSGAGLNMTGPDGKIDYSKARGISL